MNTYLNEPQSLAQLLTFAKTKWPGVPLSEMVLSCQDGLIVLSCESHALNMTQRILDAIKKNEKKVMVSMWQFEDSDAGYLVRSDGEVYAIGYHHASQELRHATYGSLQDLHEYEQRRIFEHLGNTDIDKVTFPANTGMLHAVKLNEWVQNG